MDLEKVYYDSHDNPLNILRMIAAEPEWAANRLQDGEKAFAGLIVCRKELATATEKEWRLAAELGVCKKELEYQKADNYQLRQKLRNTRNEFCDTRKELEKLRELVREYKRTEGVVEC